MARGQSRRDLNNRLNIWRVLFMVGFAYILYYCYGVVDNEAKEPVIPQKKATPHPSRPRGITLTHKKVSVEPNAKLPLVRQDLREIAEYYIGGRRLTASAPHSKSAAKKEELPNFLLMVFDDSGYGDLGVNVMKDGHQHVSHTPFLDKLASKGLRMTDFYVTCSICTPSRASIMTGRYGPRTGVTGHVAPKSRGGLPSSELTIADHLRPLGYDSIILGKWHLGHVPPHDPISHGFDEWLGIPFSNDMGCTDEPLGATNKNKPDTPSAFACPPISETSSFRVPDSLQDNYGVLSRFIATLNRAWSRLVGLSGSVDTAGLSADHPPPASELAPEYTNNKWVKMGKGDPTVLPLFHGCALRHTLSGCMTAIDRTTVDVSSTCPSNGKNASMRQDKSHYSNFDELIREQPTDLWRLSDRLVDRATTFIKEHSIDASRKKVHPFFLYMPLVHTHIPHTPHKRFVKQATNAHHLHEGDELSSLGHMFKSSAKKEESVEDRAMYGASLREADDMARQVAGALEQAGGSTFDNTLTIVTSDNGPWLIQDSMGGSPLPFRGGKFSTNEGGVRVFCLAHWPRVFGSHVHRHHAESPGSGSGVIQSGESGVYSNLLTSTLDFVPTFVALAQGELPVDRSFDGNDLSPFLFHVGEFRQLYFNYHHDAVVEGSQRALGKLLAGKARLASTRYRPGAYLIQEGGGFSALRVGKYKIGNMNVLKEALLTQVMANMTVGNNLQVFDLEHDPAEHHKLNDHEMFQLRRPVKAESEEGGWQEDYASLTFSEFRIVAVYIREWILNDIRLTFKSDGATRKLQDSGALPCAKEVFDGTMCVKCPCDADLHQRQSRKSKLPATPLPAIGRNLGRRC